MKTLRLITLALPTMLAACTPANPPPEEGADTRALTLPTATPPPVIQATALQEVNASGVSGDLEVVPREAATEFAVSVHNAPPNAFLAVRVHSGACSDPGRELAAIDTIQTDATGRGQIRTTVAQAPDLLMGGNRILAVYAPGAGPAQARPIACTRIPLQDAPVAAPEGEAEAR